MGDENTQTYPVEVDILIKHQIIATNLWKICRGEKGELTVRSWELKGQTNSGNHQVTLFGEEGKREGKGGRERGKEGEGEKR